MAESTTNKRNAISGFISVTLIAVFTITLIYLPFTTVTYSVSTDDYEYNTFYFGYWTHYKNGDLYDEGGAADLENFPISSPILIIIALVISFMCIPGLISALIKNVSFYRKHRRIFGLLTAVTGIIGFIGVLLQISFFKSMYEFLPDAKYSSGFITAIIIFSLFFIAGAIAAIYPKIGEYRRFEPREETLESF